MTSEVALAGLGVLAIAVRVLMWRFSRSIEQVGANDYSYGGT